MDWITNNSMRLIQKGLDFTWQKQKIISENIANAETPGYKSKYITFEEELRSRLDGSLNSLPSQRGEAVREAVQNTRFKVNISRSESSRLDGNNVNVDVENVELARTQLQYEFLTRQMNDQFNRLRTVINGR